MKKEIKEYKFEFLKVFADGMEKEGVKHSIYNRDIDEEFVKELNAKINETLSLSECHKLADICLANECVEHMCMGPKYNDLRLTTTGVGVVKSKQMQIESHARKSTLKKVSDYINDHSGILALFSFFVSLVSLFVALAAIIISQKGK